ncbi:MAG: IS200/IS605 family transposase [Bacteroidetes bacterium]|nr:IS200/IS605 family transposase [Bacteroidota bacterium]
MSYTNVYIHYVWATRKRCPLLQMPYRHTLFDHMYQNALRKGIYLDRVNGFTDHIHCLVWLRPAQTMDAVAQLLKGESAYWFNHYGGFGDLKLQWQEGYFAASVCLSMIEKVRAYIDNQEQHHQKRTFIEEYEQWKKLYLLTKDLDNSLAHYQLKTRR